METEQAPQPTISLASALASYKIDTRSVRAKFVDEAYERMGKKWSKRVIAIKINFMCPKAGGDSLVVDTQKTCQTSKSGYAKTFWGLVKKAQNRA